MWMEAMDQNYVERRAGGFYLVGSRVPLDAVVREYWNDELPEAIRAHYPTLSLAQVYSAITFYLGNRDEVEAAIVARTREEEAFRESHPPPPHLQEKLARGKPRLPVRPS